MKTGGTDRRKFSHMMTDDIIPISVHTTCPVEAVAVSMSFLDYADEGFPISHCAEVLEVFLASGFVPEIDMAQDIVDIYHDNLLLFMVGT
jgi:hypothetical protein